MDNMQFTPPSAASPGSRRCFQRGGTEGILELRRTIAVGKKDGKRKKDERRRAQLVPGQMQVQLVLDLGIQIFRLGGCEGEDWFTI